MASPQRRRARQPTQVTIFVKGQRSRPIFNNARVLQSGSQAKHMPLKIANRRLKSTLLLSLTWLLLGTPDMAISQPVLTPDTTPDTTRPENAPVGAPLPETHTQAMADTIEALESPLFKPFIERYILDELKSTREAMAALRVELSREVVDREHSATSKALSYASDTVTYFFYLIAGVSSILVIIGWNSLRDIRERVVTVAEAEVNKLVKEYESRLQAFERVLSQKTEAIEENKEQIERTQEIHALWMRAGLENAPSTKLALYDNILEIDPQNYEALTYKADAVLQMDEPQWAISLCQQALALDPDYSHAFYQLACASTQLEKHEEAIFYLGEALKRSEALRHLIETDTVLEPLREMKAYHELMDAPIIGLEVGLESSGVSDAISNIKNNSGKDHGKS